MNKLTPEQEIALERIERWQSIRQMAMVIWRGVCDAAKIATAFLVGWLVAKVWK